MMSIPTKLKSVYRFMSDRFQTLHLDYRVTPKPRKDLQPHKLLYEQIDRHRQEFALILESFKPYFPRLQEIKPAAAEKDPHRPAWNNGFLPGLDIIALYGMIAKHRPAHYVEIGSGNSTKVARMAINDQGLGTRITSIDPYPRADIDPLSDEIIREPLEAMGSMDRIVDLLQPGDILFIDNSHRVFPNSDAMTCFMEILPYLRKGVIVHIHDIYLPYDYPQFMCDRFYNEQYFLAALLMGDRSRYEVLLPNYFISEDKELSGSIASIWDHPNLKGVERHGGSFWMRIR